MQPCHNVRTSMYSTYCKGLDQNPLSFGESWYGRIVTNIKIVKNGY
jgi:hypothetical protein